MVCSCPRTVTNSSVVVRIRCSLRLSSTSNWSATPETCSASHLSHCWHMLFSRPSSPPSVGVLCALLLSGGSGYCSGSFLGCLGPYPGARTCSLPKFGKTCSLPKPSKACSLPRSGCLRSPRSMQPSVLPVPVFPRLLESVPLPVAEFLRPLEPVPLPVALDPALVRVVPMSRPVLPQPPPPWFPGGSSIQSSLVPVLASAL